MVLQGGQFTTLCMRAAGREVDDEILGRIPKLHEALDRVPDVVFDINVSSRNESPLVIRTVCYMQFKFETWVPLLGRILPTDTCRVTKIGCGIRLDCTLAGMKGLSWKRGRLSFVYLGDKAGYLGKMYVFDHIGKRYADMTPKQEKPGDVDSDDEEQIIEVTDMFLVQSTPSMDWWSRDVVFAREQVSDGWFSGTSTPLTETIAGFPAHIYKMSGLRVDVMVRGPLEPSREAEITEVCIFTVNHSLSANLSGHFNCTCRKSSVR
jgi:hypothetical protein